jgi:hypothetical protein
MYVYTKVSTAHLGSDADRPLDTLTQINGVVTGLAQTSRDVQPFVEFH